MVGSGRLAERMEGERTMTKLAKTGAACRRRMEGNGRDLGLQVEEARRHGLCSLACELNGPKAG